MPTPQRRPFTGPEVMKRKYVNAIMHLLEAAYWVGITAALMFADVTIWVWCATAVIAVPIYALITVEVRSRLGILV